MPHELPAKTPKLSEIARRIYDHLQRMEFDPRNNRGSGSCRFWQANAWTAGSRVGVRYKSFHSAWHLTKAEALTYLKWLDANPDKLARHFEILRGAPSTDQGA